MKVVFLDIDGVLAHSHYKNPQTENLDPKKVLLLKKIVVLTGAKVVLSSTWRLPYYENEKAYKTNSYNILNSLLKQYELEIYDETPIIELKFLGLKEKNSLLTIKHMQNLKLEPNTTRAGEINTWLKNNKEVESFIILDDDDSYLEYFGYDQNLIKTSYYDGGLKEEHIEKAVEILNHKQRKIR